MKKFCEMEPAALKELLDGFKSVYEEQKAKGMKLDMSRGKPGAEQIKISMPMLNALLDNDSTVSEDGTQCANYGGIDGIPEAKRLMSGLMGLDASETIVGGNSSLNLMHDVMSYCWMFDHPGGIAWSRQDEVKFLCPVPGYDRHFAVTEHFGITMIPVPMTSNGPDMDIVEDLAVNDASIKGMWCVPKYSNPQGITYSDETVLRIARMEPAASDFRIFWDDAYTVHDLYDDNQEKLLPLMPELRKHGHENNAFLFASTSKISIPGAGISAVAASAENISFIKKHKAFQTIGPDKLNQLRHARFFKDMDGIYAHMKRHAEIVRPKFELVLGTLEARLGGLGVASWGKPLGGYFISLDTLGGCAKRVVALCKEAGLIMTPAGATHPYGNDPDDKTIRIAPTFPGLDELESAAELLCLCVKIASVEKTMVDHSRL